MSGFEIAGVVLAAIPLFIAAAEHYRDGLSAVDRFRKRERILQHYIEDLHAQVTHLESVLMGILADIDLDLATKKALLANPGGELWRLPIVRAKMAEKWGGQRVYTDLVVQLNRMHDMLLAQLDSPLSKEEFHTLVQRNVSTAEALNRVKFTWRSPKRNEMLQGIKDCNKFLRQMQGALKMAEPFYRQLRADEMTAVFEVRHSARQLFDVLSQCCTCNCDAAHEARLCLKRSYREDATDDEVCFQALIYHSPHAPCETTVRVSTSGPKSYPVNIPRVTFSHQVIDPATCRPTTKELRDICATISSAHANDEQLELHIDPQRRLWECSRRSASLAKDYEDVTLEAMLAATSPYAHVRWLKKQKALLALKLAYSLLQLHESAWSRHYWSRQCIFFLRDRSARPQSIDFAQPYVSTQLLPLKLQPPPTQLAVNAISANIESTMLTKHPVPSLLALGVVLLELQLNGPITSRINDPAQDLRFAAFNVLEECIGEDMIPKYYQLAIESCIMLSSLSVSPPRRSSEDVEFRTWYYQHVISRLTDHITDEFDISHEDLARI